MTELWRVLPLILLQWKYVRTCVHRAKSTRRKFLKLFLWSETWIFYFTYLHTYIGIQKLIPCAQRKAQQNFLEFQNWKDFDKRNSLYIPLYVHTYVQYREEYLIEISKPMKQTTLASTPNNGDLELSLLRWQQTFFKQTNNNIIIFT